VSAVAERPDSEVKRSAKHLDYKHVVLRCVVFQNKRGEYTAECIDLDLMVRGKTQHEALRSLRQAIAGYLQVVMRGDQTGLLPRPAPLSHRLRYHLYALRAALWTKRDFLLCDCTPGIAC
jgi:hypothetical protein